MLEKIKEFFRKLFDRNKQQVIDEPKIIDNSTDKKQNQFKKDFETQVVFKNEEEKNLKLQRNFESGNLNVEELSEEEFKALVKLYEKQIKETEESIERYKSKIEKIKIQIAENN